MKFFIIVLALTGTAVPVVALAHVGDHASITDSLDILHHALSSVTVWMLLVSITFSVSIFQFRRKRDCDLGASGR